MNRCRRWLLLGLVASAGLLPVSCASTLRDAVINGALDYVSASTQGLLAAFLPFDDAGNQTP